MHLKTSILNWNSIKNSPQVISRLLNDLGIRGYVEKTNGRKILSKENKVSFHKSIKNSFLDKDHRCENTSLFLFSNKEQKIVHKN